MGNFKESFTAILVNMTAFDFIVGFAVLVILLSVWLVRFAWRLGAFNRSKRRVPQRNSTSLLNLEESDLIKWARAEAMKKPNTPVKVFLSRNEQFECSYSSDKAEFECSRLVTNSEWVGALLPSPKRST